MCSAVRDKGSKTVGDWQANISDTDMHWAQSWPSLGAVAATDYVEISYVAVSGGVC